MLKKIAHDLPHYLSLFGILGVSFVGFYVFAYDRVFQESIAVALAASYVVWGIVHHHIHRDLHLSVVMEYIAVSLVGLVIIYSLVLTS
jgi:hypothetical protein